MLITNFVFLITNLSIKTTLDFIFEHRKNNTNHSETDFKNLINSKWEADWRLKNFNLERFITKRELAVLFDKTLDPFSMKKVNWNGN